MDRIRALVSEELNHLENLLCNSVELKNELFIDLSKFIKGKSKRIRSLVCLLFLKANNVIIDKNIIDILYATELIHNASLLHDDVIDNAKLRRGVQTMFDKYGSELSVLSGDYILSIAVDKLLKLNNSEILNFYFSTTKEMSIAEIIQFSNRNKKTSIEQYLAVADGKTASLFSSCLKSAALLSDIDLKIADDLGKNFGILFQIYNDIEPYSSANDALNGLNTVVDILGIEKTLDLKDNYKDKLRRIINDFSDNKYKYGMKDLIELL